MSLMERERIAEQKFRPLKKMMQQTFKRLKQAAQAETLPERRVVNEFIDQVGIMISYPGFGDAAYPLLQEACEMLAESQAKADRALFHEAMAAIIDLQNRCHATRNCL